MRSFLLTTRSFIGSRRVLLLILHAAKCHSGGLWGGHGGLKITEFDLPQRLNHYASPNYNSGISLANIIIPIKAPDTPEMQRIDRNCGSPLRISESDEY